VKTLNFFIKLITILVGGLKNSTNNLFHSSQFTIETKKTVSTMSTATRTRSTRKGSSNKKKNHGTLEAENVTGGNITTTARAESAHIIEESPKKRTRKNSRISNDTMVPPSFDFPSSPEKQKASAVGIVTPSLTDLVASPKSKQGERTTTGSVRRVLSMPPLEEVSSEGSSPESSPKEEDTEKPKGKNFFGKYSESSTSIPHTILPKTREVYHIVNKMTGSLGGNGHGGAIYGELTIGSMQKMIELMKVHTGLGPDSRFIDVGSGLGKPNLHVAQDPGVEFSYGIEMEHVRWALGMANLNKVLEAGQKQGTCNVEESDRIGHRCTFQHGDITEASYFDPFTHIYMFDIGYVILECIFATL
jgi:hypothetical protein